mmetsp:Transcript_42411/g.113470  ORF Transcript_42411/g.113470 Transcript_42411/m.113470 type:complete len:143 (+) Transcript_42411:64-492(+)|eukprot:CAMPEP_0113677288 /NCGR_PEP_ID=MMETSP0038_2-20120614/9169_1 /TAXON_ID=2898 /ORGANISM="Cryptomonas paramecium" /LENGTH=142 /DNA_ID=CAMNT_0000594519 /DNA_START=64 /DNA_END=492 /DNA_ORIENTATION=+ /assembly_acc=CAM_ASM_000170
MKGEEGKGDGDNRAHDAPCRRGGVAPLRVRGRSRRVKSAALRPRFRQDIARSAKSDPTLNARTKARFNRVVEQLQLLAEKREQMRQMQEALARIQTQNRELEERNRMMRLKIAAIEEHRRLASLCNHTECPALETASFNGSG